MRTLPAFALVAALFVPIAGASAQVSSYTWTLKGNPGGSGQVLANSLHVVGPDDGSAAQNGHVTWLETSTPVPIHVTVVCNYTNTDDGENDAPVWVLDGVYTKPATGGYWGTGPYDFSFDVLPGHTFGFGIWTSDAILGAGIGDFVNFVAAPYTWFDWGGGIDPRPWFLVAKHVLADSICGIGDVDGDGVRELVVDSHEAVVTVYSGATGAPLCTVAASPNTFSQVDDAGDVNADGVADFVFGTGDVNGFDGRVEVRSGLDGSLVFALDGAAGSQSALGLAVAGLGDVDGDGFDDVAATAAGAPPHVLVLGGLDGHLLHQIDAPTGANVAFGEGLAAIDDVDLDGARDLAVTQTVPGFVKVMVYSGRTGVLLSTATEPDTSPGLITSALASVGDFNGDGRGDFAWYVCPSTLSGGKVSVRSGLTGGELQKWKLTNSVSESYDSVTSGDLNGDGLRDVAFSLVDPAAPGDTLVRVYSGTAGHPLLWELQVPGGDHGAFVRAFGDVDLDGAADLAIGPYESDGGVQVLHALDGNGLPNLHGNGTLVGGTSMALVIKDGKANSPYTMVVGATYLGVPFKGGTLVPQPFLLLPGVLNGFGRATVGATWPVGLAGPLNFWAQGWIVDDDAPHGLTATNGLSGSVP